MYQHRKFAIFHELPRNLRNAKYQPTTMSENQRTGKYKWLLFGLLWGVIMVVIMGVFEPMYYDESITSETITHDILLWVPAGLVLGLIQHFLSNRKKA